MMAKASIIDAGLVATGRVGYAGTITSQWGPMNAVVQPSANALCPCGSGLSRARCCELESGSLGAPEAARQLRRSKPRPRGVARAAMPRRPHGWPSTCWNSRRGRIGCLVLLYDIRRQQGQGAAAEALVRRIVALDPNHFWATNEITLMLLGKGDVAAAELHARNAVRIAPENAQAHYLMGMVMTEAFRPAVGEYHYHSRPRNSPAPAIPCCCPTSRCA